MGKQMGQTIVIDNRPGAAGIIGTEVASKAPGDGYTLLTGDNGAMVFHTALYKSLPYNPADFVPIGFMASFPLILVVNPNAGFANAAQFLEAVKRNPGKYSYASPGAGSPHHLAMELLKQRTGSFIVHVPYRGTAPAMQDVMSGQVPIMVVDTAAGLAQIRSGKLKALAVLSKHRIALLPDVPTLSEVGGPRAEGLRGQRLARPVRAQGHAARHRRAPDRRDAQGHPDARRQGAPGGLRPRGGAQRRAGSWRRSSRRRRRSGMR